MNILKKRSTAIIIVVIAAILFTMIGVRRSLDREAKKVQALFYDGVGSETAVQTYLDNEFREAKTVYSIASKYLDDEVTNGFRTAYNDMYNAETVREKYLSYAKLTSELSLITQAIDDSELTRDESKYFTEHVNNMKNIQRMIDSCSYNEKVAEFETKTLGAFPANIFKKIVNPSSPEYFGGEALREG